MCAPSRAAQIDVGGGPIELSDMQLLDFGSGALEDEFDVQIYRSSNPGLGV